MHLYWNTGTTVMVIVMVVVIGGLTLAGWLADKEGDK